ncbi:acetyl-CoA carboxylase biotin carboxyl carrier protein [Dictyobacter formicarum]|uniref:Biotin carboxyl carrier protein of acetyl-CoA carboxylase n=1 Tax=Dictyobacter formicarum TaxID=2778368 RepID=A0ABQ3VRD8_9CHLR|nr:biotin/lipoyl-containing protein [Dictyobacter formicarum]GHO88279.1 acetyl-CoA carboxylase, biotin carboxyl carrier protein [Dictyobacter formicarum]
MDTQNNSSWLERVEEIVDVLEGSTVGELTLTEDGTEITIRRSPGMVLTNAPTTVMVAGQAAALSAGHTTAPKKVDKSLPVTATLTGVYYSSASPTSPPFVNIGDVIHVGQVVALIEAMKVFNEINAEVSGRVVAINAVNGSVIQKGEAIMRVEPL